MNGINYTLPSPERLREIFDLDPATGVLRWREVLTFSRAKIGDVAGSKHRGYVRLHFQGQRIMAHRVVWAHYYGRNPLEQIDHINGDKSDNRICNLREATHQQNSANRPYQVSNKARLKGVTWRGYLQKWAASIQADGVKYHLGYFPDAESAHAAYAAAAVRLHGDFARVA